MSETSGVRIGTPALTTRGMKEEEMRIVGDLILRAIFDFDSSRGEILATVDELCTDFPLYQGGNVINRRKAGKGDESAHERRKRP